MRILVTGGSGYIGSALMPLLSTSGVDARNCDLNWFAGARQSPCGHAKAVVDDFRALDEEAISHFDAIIHLAAFSNDPLGSLRPGETQALNETETLALAARAKRAGVRKFVFASSCSVYGNSGSAEVDETSLTSPLTAYAKAKRAAEIGLLELHDENFRVAALRGATAFGFSECPRTDLLLNEFCAFAALDEPLVLRSDGQSWRPFMPTEDFARALITAAMTEPRDPDVTPIWNIAPPRLRMTVSDAVSRAAAAAGAPPPRFGQDAAIDLRSYRVVGDAFLADFPEFSFAGDFEAEIVKTVEGFRQVPSLEQDIRNGRFVRLRMLQAQENASLALSSLNVVNP